MDDKRYAEFDFVDFDKHSSYLKALFLPFQNMGVLSNRHRCGLCTVPEYTALFEVTMGLHSPCDLSLDIIEIGQGRGGSSLVFASALRAVLAGKLDTKRFSMTPKKLEGCPSAVIFSVDRRRTRFGFGELMIARGVIDQFNLSQFVCFVIDDSVSFLSRWGGTARIVFVDGTHSYEKVVEDIKVATSVLADDGWLCFHDYSAGFGAKSAVDEFLIDSEDEDLDIFLVDNLLLVHFQKNQRATGSESGSGVVDE